MEDSRFQDFVDEVLERTDIVELISEYTKLKRVGSRFAALCPLHNDKKSPSLSVSPEKQLFYCFGCGAGGNAIHFMMGMENLEFMDALKLLAERARIPVPEFGKGGREGRQDTADKKRLIYQINSEAARYFYQCLAGGAGAKALAYLRARGITNAAIKMFGLGYAPEGWTSLLEYLKEKGYREHDIYEAGLAKMRDNGTFYDTFYDGRVMFPIINVQGNIIGFGGRVMQADSKTGKYLNTPETLVFKKKENLFGLNLAKNDKSGRFLLMEGYMDVISLHQAGISSAVASLGTAFTPEQAKLIKKYGRRIVLCYDADEAGRKATIRAGEILTENNIKTRVLTVTEGKDPDEFIQSKGPVPFQKLIEGAKPLIEYRIDEIKQQYDLKDTDQLLDFTEAAAQVLAKLSNPVEQEIYTKRVAEMAGISPERLAFRIGEIHRKRQKAAVRQEEREERRRFEQRTGGRRDLEQMGLDNAQKLLLNLMCSESVFKKVKEAAIIPEDFKEGIHRTLAGCIFDLWERGDPVQKELDINQLLEQFEGDNRGQVAAILLDDKNIEHINEACKRPLKMMKDEKMRRQQTEMLKQAKSGQMEREQLEQLDRLLRKRKLD